MEKQVRKVGRPRKAAGSTAGENVLKVSRDGVEKIWHEAENFSRMTRECVNLCNGTLSASVKSGNAASRTLREVSSQLIENMHRAFSDNTELFKEAVACRTARDLTQWQEQFWQTLTDHYLEEANNLRDTLFDGYNEALETLKEQVSHASTQLRKAAA